MHLSHLHTAIEASVKAGEAIMEVYATDFEVISKQDDSPLTIADQEANDIIISYLVKTGIPIISEENKQIEYDKRRSWKQCWIVDPLDGTKEFVKRNGEFTVNIALVEDGVPTLGVIYIPVTKTLYFTASDGKSSYRYAFIDSKENSVEFVLANAIPMSPKVDQEFVYIVGSRSHLNDATKNFILQVEKHNRVHVISRGSSLKFCVIAEGNAQLYPRFAPTMEWDTAAGHAICRAVGVEVLNQETQQPLLYNKENLLNPDFVVSVIPKGL